MADTTKPAANVDASQPLVWIDCEMTGLDPENDVIVEIFCIITNGQLEILHQDGWHGIIHQTRETMDKMVPYVQEMHRKSGLTEKVLVSTLTAEQAAEELLAYIQKYVPKRKEGLLAGNSVHADRAFLCKEPYKKCMSWLHHRIVDVSTIKEVADRWSPKSVVRHRPTKKGLHQAREDILESIEEAAYYKAAIFDRVPEHQKPKK